MTRKLFAAVLALVLVLSCGSVISVLAEEFKPSNENVVNIFCGFEDGDWMPMMHDTITDKDQLNISNFDIAISDKNAFTGSNSYEASCHSTEGGYVTFEWYQVKDGKHIYERNGNTDLMALYNAGKGMNLTNADYLQFYVKNEANKPLVIKWLRIYGGDAWELKPFAKYVYILRDGEWEQLSIQNSFITIPRKYEGFIRVELRADNFKSGAWNGKSLDKSLITAVGTYLHADAGGVTGKLYIDDLAFVGKNLDIGNSVCKVTKINEKDYFADFLGLEDEPVETRPVETEPVETEPVETEPVETDPAETKPADTFTEVNETVYTTQGVNVRSEASSESNKLGFIEADTAVVRTGIGDNGWSRIEYNGKVAYVYSKYLTTTNPNPDASEPVQTEPVETQPVETEPVETEPVETEPVETEPVETEPVETEPVETESVETEPVETDPAETDPAPTEPKPTEPGNKEETKGGFLWWIIVVVVLLGGGAAAVLIVHKKTGKWL